MLLVVSPVYFPSFNVNRVRDGVAGRCNKELLIIISPGGGVLAVIQEKCCWALSIRLFVPMAVIFRLDDDLIPCVY